MAGWTLGWTLFQWWAVVGWPPDVSPLSTAGVLTAVLSLVGLAIWRDVHGAFSERRQVPGLVVPLRLPVRAGGRAGAARRQRRIPALATPPADRRAA